MGENPRSAESISPESMLIDHADPTIPMVWEGTVMSGESPFGDVEDDADLLRPSWQDTPDETDADRRAAWRPRPTIGQAPSAGPDAWLSGTALAGLLIPLCDATDALARLDARAAAAPDAVRDGLRARMATAEAAGWLAHAHAWVHPLDLSLRAAGLTASTALAAVGHGARSLPQTFAGPADPLDWADPPFEAMADGDRAVADALSLVRLLRRLPGRPTTGPFATPVTAAAALAPLGAGALDPARLAAWWAAHAPAPPVPRRYGSRAGEGTREKPCRRCSRWRSARRPRLDGGHAHRPPGPTARTARRYRPVRQPGTGAQRLPAGLGRLSGRGVFRARRIARPAQRRRRSRRRPRPARSPGRSPSCTSWRRARGWVCANSIAWKPPPSRAGVVAGSDKRSRLPDALDAAAAAGAVALTPARHSQRGSASRRRPARRCCARCRGGGWSER